MSRRPHAPPPRPLCKQQSWSPDMLREEAWQRRKDSHVRGDGAHRMSKSLSEDDLEELKACIELGFGFESPEIDPKLSDTIPALELFHAVNKQYSNHGGGGGGGMSRSSSSSSIVSDSDTASPTTLFLPGDDQAAKKTRLKQWAQVVACAVRQSSSQSQPSSSDPINYNVPEA